MRLDGITESRHESSEKICRSSHGLEINRLQPDNSSLHILNEGMGTSQLSGQIFVALRLPRFGRVKGIPERRIDGGLPVPCLSVKE